MFASRHQPRWLYQPIIGPDGGWFRDAWVRSHNGGPIDISLPKARAIQFRQIKLSVNKENTRRLEEIDLFDCAIEPDWGAIRDAIRQADDVDDLRRVWPSDSCRPRLD
jgi:hypothetical protein